MADTTKTTIFTVIVSDGEGSGDKWAEYVDVAHDDKVPIEEAIWHEVARRYAGVDLDIVAHIAGKCDVVVW